MKKRAVGAGLILMLLLAAGACQEAVAQKATEIYIPLGQSPGLSGYTKIGTVTSVDLSAGTLSLTDSLSRVHTVRLTDSTAIWLDRSRIKERNSSGSRGDIEVGQRAEVKFYLAPDSTYLESAEWIKIQLGGP